eukprot:5660353-Pleurochrysis_carterae.AAC.3
MRADAELPRQASPKRRKIESDEKVEATQNAARVQCSWLQLMASTPEGVRRPSQTRGPCACSCDALAPPDRARSVDARAMDACVDASSQAHLQRPTYHCNLIVMCISICRSVVNVHERMRARQKCKSMKAGRAKTHSPDKAWLNQISFMSVNGLWGQEKTREQSCKVTSEARMSVACGVEQPVFRHTLASTGPILYS